MHSLADTAAEGSVGGQPGSQGRLPGGGKLELRMKRTFHPSSSVGKGGEGAVEANAGEWNEAGGKVLRDQGLAGEVRIRVLREGGMEGRGPGGWLGSWVWLPLPAAERGSSSLGHLRAVARPGLGPGGEG